MKKNTLAFLLLPLFAGAALAQSAAPAAAQATAAISQAAIASTPDGLIRAISNDVLAQIKADPAIQAGDTNKIMALVNQKIMPHVNFRRMTASAVGRSWRSATPQQQAKLEAEFKTLLVRTYSGAMKEVQNHSIDVKRLRAAPEDKEVVVKSELRAGGGQPVALDYRLEKAGPIWRVYDVNVAGIWLVETYRADFGSVINAEGIDGLISKLEARNKLNAGK